ncbi:tripartite motif-containing protein 34-like [Perognathus longimembris pacificus]|uniref:tripartite motif-containing protein 34-like n=1 Tax=Perognathus longimembris pacificus TaxID=214514 RepID=UPI00201968EB|nr:tripartite motif-containing protein 34-like [Perognathus longimembris pacificus]XP_048217571.1 tripartite motif-containing protein 34-like [Perognathus longimembris pacificus]
MNPLNHLEVSKQEEHQDLEQEEANGSAMTSQILMNIQQEVTCPICLGLLKEPLSLHCGHSFCQACITMSNEKAMMDSERESSCPVCGIRYSPENQWANQHLAGIVRKLMEVKLSPDTEQERHYCVHHGEKLLLFCEEDRKAICRLCERSQEHCGHHTFLLEEVVKEWQERLHSALTRLRKEKQEAEALEANIREEKNSWKYQVQTERQRIQREFMQLRGILDYEEQRELQRLEEEEKEILDSLAQSEDQLAQQSQLVRELISDLEHRSQWSTTELLQDTSGIMKWSEIWTLKKPKAVSSQLKSMFQAPDLSGMLQEFRELRDARCYWEDFTLNSINLNLNLVLSEDQRQVQSAPIWPFKCYNYGILGSQYFSSGKHYWEIDVTKKKAWILGVYCRKRSVRFGIRQTANNPNVYYGYKPQYGYWVIGLQKRKYHAFEDPHVSSLTALPLFQTIPPHRIGVLLNCEARTISFFNVTGHGSLIYRFSNCCFSQPAYPYFNPWNCPAPMTLCPPAS